MTGRTRTTTIPDDAKSTMTRTITGTGIAAAILVLAGVLAGCSASQPDPGRPTGPAETSSDHAVASCMRDAGYDVTDDDYRFTPTTGDVQGQQDALAECTREHDPEAAREAESGRDSAEFRALALKVAECMRKAGYTDYPDDPERADAYRAPAGDTAYADVLGKCYEGSGAKVQTK
ncbi:hypothetical protein [Curtobacterium sp. P97]|uniref:hypothetical protein n=1 Tax=Curtobacterium sp. P97 TaxID=2939562 RepID=UPI00203D64CF|nr:hypothetical protein [Curtobacterium sp. P97]MCM3522021.1 hypothetical protein [Curtobacterium sp. P97]